MSRTPPVLKVILALGGLAILLTAVGVGGVLWQIRKESARWPSLAETPPVHAPTAPQTGDGRAWSMLAAAMASYQDQNDGYAEILSVEGRPARDQLDVWRAQAPALEGLRDVVEQTEGLAVPLPETLDGEGPNLIPLLRLSEAWLVKAWADDAAGQPALAVTEMLQVARLGTRLTEGDSGLIGVMVGLSICRTAQGELLELLAATAETDGAPGLLAQAGEGWVQLVPGAVARGLVQDARMMESLLTSMADPGGAAEELGGGPLAKLTYDPDLTVVWHRMQMQPIVDAAATPAWERQPVEELVLWDPDSPGVMQRLHNPAGRVMLSIATPSFSNMVAREDEAVAASRVAALWIAARRHAAAHDGVLPAGQDALVPDLLAAPLVDPYDGQPLRMEGGRVWSIGEAQQTADKVILGRVL